MTISLTWIVAGWKATPRLPQRRPQIAWIWTPVRAAHIQEIRDAIH